MSDSFDPFEDDELLPEEFSPEEDWVEISDIEGHTASFRHLATMHVDDKTYHVLGASREREGHVERALMLVREDTTVDGAAQHVIASDEKELERVVTHFIRHVMEMHARMHEGIDSFEEETQEDGLCSCMHGPGEFCYCGDPAYLQ